jgi:hypothetical protein
MMAVIRNITTENNDHNQSAERMMKPDERATVGARWGERSANGGIPYGFIEIPRSITYPSAEVSKGLKMEWKSDDPNRSYGYYDHEKNMWVPPDPTVPGKYIPPECKPVPRLPGRRNLLSVLERNSSLSVAPAPIVQAMQKNRELAFSLLLGGGKFMEAFNPKPEEIEEYKRDMERYGDNSVGRAMLLARRLAPNAGRDLSLSIMPILRPVTGTVTAGSSKMFPNRPAASIKPLARSLKTFDMSALRLL